MKTTKPTQLSLVAMTAVPPKRSGLVHWEDLEGAGGEGGGRGDRDGEHM